MPAIPVAIQWPWNSAQALLLILLLLQVQRVKIDICQKKRTTQYNIFMDSPRSGRKLRGLCAMESDQCVGA